MSERIFDKQNVILTPISEDDLNSFLIDIDIGDDGKPRYMLNEFVNAIINTIPEYVFANYENPNIPQNDSVEKLRESARSIFKIKDYELMSRYYLHNDQSALEIIKKKQGNSKKGEFGELLLHLLLREFKHTIPLVSKVYFKDSAEVPAHGFDVVHVTDDGILWLGESKFYEDGKEGLKSLLKDLSKHYCKTFLDEQFTIIKKNLEYNNIPERDAWIEKLSNCNKLRDKINTINIPMLCTYQNDIYNIFDKLDCNEAIEYNEKNIRELKKYFDDNNNHALKDSLNIILFLFPIRDKKELMIKLYEKLWHLQNI